MMGAGQFLLSSPSQMPAGVIFETANDLTLK
jgi:hypothetical protein